MDFSCSCTNRILFLGQSRISMAPDSDVLVPVHVLMHSAYEINQMSISMKTYVQGEG